MKFYIEYITFPTNPYYPHRTMEVDETRLGDVLRRDYSTYIKKYTGNIYIDNMGSHKIHRIYTYDPVSNTENVYYHQPKREQFNENITVSNKLLSLMEQSTRKTVFIE